MKAIGLQCPDCQIPVFCKDVVLKDERAYFIGSCSKCKQAYRFCVESLLAQLLDVPCVVVLASSKTVQ